MGETLISVIITNYNYELYIAEAIESVLNQTYMYYEIIIVDDGSVDNSLQVIREYQLKHKGKINVIAQQNLGQASAFNNAFKQVRGEIVAFLDADDYWYPNKLETIVEYHKRYPAIQHNLSVNNQAKMTILEDKVQKQKYAWENYAFAGFIPTSGLSFSKESVEFIFPIQDAGYKVCADWYLKSMYLNEYDIFSLNESLGCYRAHGENYWYLNSERFRRYGDFIFEQANLYRARKGKNIIALDAGDYYKDYLYSTLNLDKQYKYILFGTGQLGAFFYHKMKSEYEVIGFTNSKAEEESTFEGLPCMPLIKVIHSMVQEYRILIATDSLGEIEYLLQNLGICAEQIVFPQL